MGKNKETKTKTYKNNKIELGIKKLKDSGFGLVHIVIVSTVLLELLIMVIANIFKIDALLNIGARADSILNVLSPIMFGLIMIAYSFSKEKMYAGVIMMAAIMSSTVLIYLILGCSLQESVQITGLELHISIIGVIIMTAVLLYKRHKLKKKDTKLNKQLELKDLFSEHKRTKFAYKFIAYNLMFTALVIEFKNNEYLMFIDNYYLKSLVVLQATLPLFIMIAYITFTDLAKQLIVIYSIVYAVISITALIYTEMNIFVIFNLISFLAVGLSLIAKKKLKEGA